MLSIIASTASTPPNLPAIAGFYSQLAGVLAGFSFAGLIALVAAQLTVSNTASKTLESGAPLLASFVALIVSSLNYAVVAGEVAGSARVATLQTLSGMGFSVAGLMLFYSLLVLVRGLENDSARSGPVSRAMGNLIRAVIVCVVAPLVVLLMWSGLRDHTGHKYGADAGFTPADWVAVLSLILVLSAAVFFAITSFTEQRHHPILTRRISYLAVLLVTVSIVSCAGLISFTENSVETSDVVPSTALVLVALFSVLVAYSASRYAATDDSSATTPTTDEPERAKSSSDLRADPTARRDGSTALEPVDRAVLARRSIDIFPQGYLTNISIIQGVALAALATETLKALTRTESPLPPWPTVAQSVFTFVAIALVSYEYLWFTTIMRWTPTFRDTAIPLVLGAAEIVPAFLLDRPIAWWAGTAVFTGCGAIAFANTVTRLSADMFPGEARLYRSIRSLLIRLCLICVAASLSSWAAVIALANLPELTAVVTGVGSLILVVPTALVVVAYSEHVLNEVYARYGIDRRPPLFRALRATRHRARS